MNPYHRFLLNHRVYCALCTGPMPATQVVRIKFKDECVCDAHARAFKPIETGLRERYRLESKINE